MKLRLSEEKDMMNGWCFEPDDVLAIRDEYEKRNGNEVARDLEFMDDIMAILWEHKLLRCSDDE